MKLSKTYIEYLAKYIKLFFAFALLRYAIVLSFAVSNIVLFDFLYFTAGVAFSLSLTRYKKTLVTMWLIFYSSQWMHYLGYTVADYVLTCISFMFIAFIALKESKFDLKHKHCEADCSH